MEDVKLKKKKLMGIPGHIKPDLPQIKTQKKYKRSRRKEMGKEEERDGRQ